MKKILYLLSLLPLLATGQTPATLENFIWNKTYKVPTTDGINANDGSGAVTFEKKTQTFTYYDGLGRPKQKIDFRQTPFATDIITPIVYDGFGRQVKDHLPFYGYSENGHYSDNQALISTYFRQQYLDHYGDSIAYSKKQFENSPLNRILKQSAPGKSWEMGSGHEIKFDYLTNVDNEVARYSASAVWSEVNKLYAISLSLNTSHTAGKLYKTITKDENWTSGTNNSTEEFKDKEGRILLKRTYGTSVVSGVPTTEKHDTYYVYDQYGNLTYVIPPLVTNALDSGQMANLCYQYRYDDRNRLVEKKLPGKQWEFMVYDKLDRVVATGPAFSPFNNSSAPFNIGWLVTKYDAFNRVVLTGWAANSASNTSAGRTTQQTARNTDTVLSESKTTTANTVNGVATLYTTVAWPVGTTAYHILSVNYYDDYDSGVTFNPVLSYTIPTITPQPVYYNNTVKPKGMPTVNLVRIPEATTNYNFEKSYTLYDSKARPVRTFTNNYLGGYTQVDTQLDFAGKTLKTETRHKRLSSSTELKITEAFTYSGQDRLLTHTHQVNNDPVELLAENSYSHIGLLYLKKVGNTSAAPLQTVDYSYNIRGWLTGINNHNNNASLNLAENDLFAFKINYNSVQNETGYSGTALYNGNISETYWRTSADNILRKYGYKYDQMNRLQSAVYQKPGVSPAVTNSYNEFISYDKNGNITNLSRTGDFDSATQALEIDQLAYTYDTNSNRLLKVTDNAGLYAVPGFKDGTNTGNDFAYDANGNLITDLNKGINSTGTNPIKYNHLNLPTEIVISTSPLKKINYLYDANGVKVQKAVSDGAVVVTTDYLDGFQYQNTALQYFPTAEGYVNYDSGIYKYVYNYLDHLGNVRLSYTSDMTRGGLAIMEQNHYYPYGFKHTNYNVEVLKLRGKETAIEILGQNKYKYKYSGKELQDELGVNMYDFGARNYDPAIGRWMNMDPLAEERRKWSPYNYASDNPMYFVDPDGMLDHIFLTKMWNESSNGTKWTNNGDGTFSSDTVKPVSSSDNDDIVNIDTQSKSVTIIKTNDNYDTVTVDGKSVGNRKKGVTEQQYKNQGYSIWNPEGAGMGITDFGLSFAGGEMLFAKFGGYVSALWAGRAAKEISVIGPRATYREFAKKIGANFLDVTDEAWTMRKNVTFLQGVVKRGDDVIFSGKYNPARLDPSSVLAQEIRYLQRHGYSWTNDFSKLIKQ